MDYKTAVTRLRVFNYAFGVMETVRKDPYCMECRGLTKAYEAIAVSFKKFEEEVSALQGGLPAAFPGLQVEVCKRQAGLDIPVNTVSQKELGKCSLPDVCLPKAALAILAKITQ
ncbi:MAG: hypothetical protein M0018_06020 [Nitrospiraceae bacterium]|nr:hypothetical protein [Nitrospiraceae bacterium]